MSVRLMSPFVTCTLLVSCFSCVGTLRGQAPAGSDSVLSRRYKAAQAFQAAHELDKAAQQYRIFIADSLGQLALGHAQSGERDQAIDEFDEALNLVPDFPALKLEYARVALEMGNSERAQTLALNVLTTHPAEKKFAATAETLIGSALLKMGKMQEAREHFEKAVTLDPSFVNGYQLAVVDLDLGDGDAASRVFSEMNSSFGDTAELHMLFGQAYAASDFQNKAIDEFRRAAKKNPRLAGVHYALASMLLAVNGGASLAEAETELRQEIANSPGDAASFAALGHLLAGQQGDQEALADLKRATELDPQSPDAFFYLGQYDVDKKNLPEAIPALRRSVALTQDPSRNNYQVQKAHYLLGRALLQSGEAEEGKREIAASQALGRKNLSRDQDRLAIYLESPKNLPTAAASAKEPPVSNTGEREGAKKQVKEFEARFGPAIADSYNNLGAIAGSEDNFRAALTYFERAEEWNPALPGLDANWGRAAFSAGAKAEAIGPLTRQLAAHPEDDDSRRMLGLSLAGTGDSLRAKQVLLPIADKPEESPAVQIAYAESLIATKEEPEGEKRLLKLAKEQPANARVHDALGAFYTNGSSSRAVQEYETATQLDPRDAGAYAALGHLQLAHGDRRAAETNLAAAVTLQPGNAAWRADLEACRRTSATDH